MRAFLYRLGLAGGISLFCCHCTLFENKGSRSAETDLSHTVLLFSDSLPQPEATPWVFESGVERSALGRLNPAFYEVNRNPLRNPGARIGLNFFSGQKFVAVVNEVKGLEANHFVTRGVVEGVEGSSFLITSLGTQIFGIVRLGEKGNFRIETDKDQIYRLSQLNEYDLPRITEPPEPQTAKGKPVEAPVSLQGGHASSLGKKTSQQNTAYTHRIMLGAYFTSSVFRMADSSIPTAQGKLVAAVDELNDLFSNSGVDANIFLIDNSRLSNYNETHFLDTDLVHLQNPSDTLLDTVQVLRAATGADLVTLVVDSAFNRYASIGYRMTTVSDTFANYAYSVVTYRGLQLGNYGLAQAIATNMGAQFDAKSSSSRGAFTYSRGYFFKGNNGVNYRTIMTTGLGTVIPYFSSPRIIYQGRMIGLSTANNTLTLNNTASTVAGFNGANNPPSITITFPLPGSVFGGVRLMIKADVTDDQGIDSVVFFQNGHRIGKSTVMPYKTLWIADSVATYALTARAYDNGSNNSISQSVTVSLGASGLASGWTDTYLGTKGENGLATYSNTTGWLSMSSKSTNIAGVADDAQFAYKAMTGNGSVKVMVIGMGNANTYARAGVMLRDTLVPSARAAFVGVTSAGAPEFRSRLTRPGSMNAIKSGSMALPGYTMLIRKGLVVSAFSSRSGSNWSYVGRTQFASLPNRLYAGCALAGNDTNTTDTTAFTMPIIDTITNYPPYIEMNGLTQYSNWNVGDSVTLRATVSDPDGVGDIRDVYFYRGVNLIGIDSVAPYSLVWVAAVDSSTHVWAAVYDRHGGYGFSDPMYTSVYDTTVRKSITASKDAQVRNGTRYQAVNYGGSANMWVHNGLEGNGYQAILGFSIAAMATPDSATLYLNGAQTVADTTHIKIGVYAIADTTFGETTVKYSNFPTLGNALDTLVVSSASPQWFTVDVTNYIITQKAAGQTAVSFALKALNSSTAAVTFITRNSTAGGKPQLLIVK